MTQRFNTVLAFYEGDMTPEGTFPRPEWRDACAAAMHQIFSDTTRWTIVREESLPWSQAIADEFGCPVEQSPIGFPAYVQVVDWLGDPNEEIMATPEYGDGGLVTNDAAGGWYCHVSVV